MDMKIVNCEKQLCVCCMEEHEVKTVLVKEQATFKNTVVNYEALYSYCDIAEELFANKQQLQDNDIKLKDAYRAKNDLLAGSENISGTDCIRRENRV